VLVIEHRSLPIVSLRLITRSGSFFDGNLPGLAGITGELLTKGTTTRSAKQIAEEIDFVGGQLASGSDWDANFITINVLRKHLPTGLRILQDIVLHPTFPFPEFDRVRNQRIASLIQRKDDPDFIADREFARTLYRSHPYAFQADGTKESLNSIRLDNIVQFHSTTYVPNNTILAVVGDISPSEAMTEVQKMFEGWEAKEISTQIIHGITRHNGIRVVTIDKPGAVQSAIRIGHVGITRNSHDYIQAYVLNTLFGGYFQSRINQNLRETHGFTYGAHSTFDARQHEGPFTISADVRNEVTDAAISEILQEMNRIRTEQVGEEELSTVKSYIIGSFPLQIETPSQIASRALSIELYGLPRDYFSTFNSNVAAITASDIQATAGKYFHPESVAIIVSGDVQAIAPACAKFGTVTIIDVDGNHLSLERIS
jgi:zinc protease